MKLQSVSDVGERVREFINERVLLGANSALQTGGRRGGRDAINLTKSCNLKQRPRVQKIWKDRASARNLDVTSGKSLHLSVPYLNKYLCFLSAK